MRILQLDSMHYDTSVLLSIIGVRLPHRQMTAPDQIDLSHVGWVMRSTQVGLLCPMMQGRRCSGDAVGESQLHMGTSSLQGVLALVFRGI
jgi:hypothetical protein